MKKTFYASALMCFFLLNQPISAQITTPKEHFGFNIGDDYHLADFTNTNAYFKKLAQQSARIKYTVIGKTEEGKDQPMLIVTSEQNHKNLDRYKEIAQKMARAELSESEARQLSKEGKAIVWIDGGLHATETVGMHQLIEIAYQLAHKNDDETKTILDNTIVLLTHANPDGQDIVTNWYMRESDPSKRSLSYLPVLYQKYAGHDNNRDFFMLNLKESQNIARQLFIEWNPQIMYNHHQTAPAGAVVAGAPYRDPFNYVFDPLLITGIEALGAAMSNRLNSENKPGYTQRGGSVFSTWYNGGLRTTTYFHNMVGLLTEIIGGPNPFEIPLVTSRLIPNSNTHNPVLPQTWHFRQSIDYSTSLNYAVMTHAAKYKNEVLYNIYRMGRNSIEKGSKDTWALSPSKIAIIDSAYSKAKRENNALANQRNMPKEFMNSLFENHAHKDARGYIIPANEINPKTTIRFLNALSANGIKIHQATEEFSVNGKNYPANSYIIKTNQAFRPHILDMFEPQDHPNDFEYPGGPPIPPYDAAGWTLAYIMHINFDRVMEDFTGPFKELPYGEVMPTITSTIPNSRYISVQVSENETFKFVNQLLQAKQAIYRDENGNFILENNKAAKEILTNSGLPLEAIDKLNRRNLAVKPTRVALWDTYGGSMPSGWLRYLLENFNYQFEVVFAQDIDRGELEKKYDVLLLHSNAVPQGESSSNFRFAAMPIEAPKDIPEAHRSKWGRLSIEKSIPVLEQFVKAGGHIITLGNSAVLAEHFKLGVENALVDLDKKALPRQIFYTPGSVLQARIDNQSLSAKGYLSNAIDVYFNNDKVYKINDPSIKPILWFEGEKVLRSGWSWGEKHLKDGVIAFEKNIEKGKLTVFTTDITFRSQTHGTFKLLLNNLYK